MNKFTINKAIISDSKVTLFLNQSVEDDFIERLEHYFRVIDETNHIMKNSFFGNYNPNTNKTNNNNNKTNNKMKNNNLNNTNHNSRNMNCHKMMPISLEEAKEWYNSDNDVLKTLALRAFSKEELGYSFRDIKTFEDACNALGISFDVNSRLADETAIISNASAAMFKLSIIRKALNLGHNLYLTKNPKDSYIYYPYNPLVTENCTCYNSEVSAGQKEVIGIVKIEGTLYSILGGTAYHSAQKGLGCFNSEFGVNLANSDFAFLGCATKEIAKHFGKYFGMLITEAKFGDFPGFTIINSKYNN